MFSIVVKQWVENMLDDTLDDIFILFC